MNDAAAKAGILAALAGSIVAIALAAGAGKPGEPAKSPPQAGAVVGKGAVEPLPAVEGEAPAGPAVEVRGASAPGLQAHGALAMDSAPARALIAAGGAVLASKRAPKGEAAKEYAGTVRRVLVFDASACESGLGIEAYDDSGYSSDCLPADALK
jgi:hypothetical protein